MNSDVKGLPDVARAAGATVDQLRYWLRLLGIEPVKEGKTRMVTPDDAEKLSNMARMVSGGVSPKEAAARIAAAPVPSNASLALEPTINTELAEMKKAMIEMAATFQRETAAMRAELTAIREKLETPPAPLVIEAPKPVKVWEPVRVQPPAMPWYERAWCILFSPEAFREVVE
jgi:DNA-binding transcriptional MerR regulator